MRAHAAFKHGVAVDGQVVRRDGGGDVGAGIAHEIHRILGGDMFEHDLQRREIGDDAIQDAIDEHRLAVEDVDCVIGHLAVDEQRHADALHRFQGRIDVAHIGDAMGAVGGGVGRIKLGGGEDALRMAAHQFVRIDAIDQIAGHQRLEFQARRNGGANAVPIGSGSGSGRHRRFQIWHHDGTGELARGGIGHGGQHLAITQVNMPIIGAAQGERCCHAPPVTPFIGWRKAPRNRLTPESCVKPWTGQRRKKGIGGILAGIGRRTWHHRDMAGRQRRAVVEAVANHQYAAAVGGERLDRR